MIGGDISFSTSDAFAADTPVVVSFHTLPKQASETADTSSSAASVPNIAVDNNEEFRALIESPQPNNATIERFVIHAGDYNPNSAHGLSFKFADVAYHDLHLTGSNIPDSIGTGQNLHIVAEILEYNNAQGCFSWSQSPYRYDSFPPAAGWQLGCFR